MFAKARDTDSYWRAWSKAVERGWLRYSNEDEVYNPKYVGRGKVEIISKKPRRDKNEGGRKKKTYLRGQEAREEIRAVRQARRCGQLAFRIQLARNPNTEGDMKAKYSK